MNICTIHGLKEKLYIGSDTYLLWDRISFGHLCGPMFQWTWRLAFPSVEWELGSTNFLGSYAASIWVVFLFGDLSFAIIVLLWVYCLFLFFYSCFVLTKAGVHWVCTISLSIWCFFSQNCYMHVKASKAPPIFKISMVDHQESHRS